MNSRQVRPEGGQRLLADGEPRLFIVSDKGLVGGAELLETGYTTEHSLDLSVSPRYSNDEVHEAMPDADGGVEDRVRQESLRDRHARWLAFLLYQLRVPGRLDQSRCANHE